MSNLESKRRVVRFLTPHIISGKMKTVMDDGTEAESGPGGVGIVPRLAFVTPLDMFLY